MDITPLILSLKLALVTSVNLLALATPIAYCAWRSTRITKSIILSVTSLPLVLPPTVLGFYILIFLGKDSSIGAFFHNTLGIDLVFSFTGLIIGSIIYSLPFMVQPIYNGLNSIRPEQIENAKIFNKSYWSIFKKIQLPQLLPAFLSGFALSFAHTLGEFGVVLMIGGNIPDKTSVASIYIYEQVETLNYDSANSYALVLIGLSLIILFATYFFNSKITKWIS